MKKLIVSISLAASLSSLFAAAEPVSKDLHTDASMTAFADGIIINIDKKPLISNLNKGDSDLINPDNRETDLL